MTEDKRTSRPGEAALKNMQLLKSESKLFKVPKVPKKKSIDKVSQVLDEDEYVEGISKIIQRDFFPDLEKLKAQNDYLQATENRDYTKLRELARKYSSGARPPTEPYNSPATFDTPDIRDGSYTPLPNNAEPRNVSEQPPKQDKPKDPTDHHSLDSFLSTHTSEDNESYNKVIAMEDKKKYAKLASQFEAEESTARLALEAIKLPSIEEQADQTHRPEEISTWRFKARNYIMYVPDGGGTKQPMTKATLQHHNSRLSSDPFDHAKNMETISAIAKSQDANTSGKIGVDGTNEKRPYSLVATPSPRPGESFDQSPLMTWGHIEGTPFRLDGGDTPVPAIGAGAAYRMLESGSRERVALQLAEQLAKRRRPTTPRQRVHTPRSNTERLASMSPAARRLVTKHLASPSILSPKTRIFNKRTPTPQTKMATPNSIARCVTPKVQSKGDNLTDNLLQINLAKRDRLKAHDFFK